MTQQQIRFYPRKELIDTHADWKDIAPAIHKQIDARLAKVEGIACREGCAHCCKLQVTVLPHEVMDVVEYVRFGDHFDRAERAEILQNLKTVVDLTEGMDQHQYRAADIACPFLGSDDHCRVYAARPMACRAFGSTNVHICDLSEEDDGTSTFRVVPDALLRLLGTSGLFYVPFLKSCLAWWKGQNGLEAPVNEGEAEAIAQIQRLIESGRVGNETPPIIRPAKRINGAHR